VINISVPPGATLEFFIFYGEAVNKIAADGALAAVGAELASYGYAPADSAGCSTANDGPHDGVYIFAFKGVGAPSIFTTVPPSSSLTPSITPSCSPSDEPSESPSVSQRPSNAPSVSNAPNNKSGGKGSKSKATKSSKSTSANGGKSSKSQKCANQMLIV